MIKKFAALAMLFSIASITPVGAEESNPWKDSTTAGANNGSAGKYTYKTGSDGARSAGRGYELQQPAGTGPSDWGTQGWGDTTKTNGAVGGSNAYGPKLRGDVSGGLFGGLDSGAAQGGPIIIRGINTGIALSNLALQTEKRSPFGGKLPETHLDSFVHKAKQSGLADLIYGDEGTQGPPPYDFFMTIQTGGVKATTGHPSDAPSAWY